MEGENWNSAKVLSFISYPASSRTIPKTTDQVLELIILILTALLKLFKLWLKNASFWERETGIIQKGFPGISYHVSSRTIPMTTDQVLDMIMFVLTAFPLMLKL